MHKKVTQEDLKEIHRMITEWGLAKGYKTSHMLSLLTAMLIGTMAMKGISEKFFDETCEMMKGKFKNHPLRDKENYRIYLEGEGGRGEI